MSGSSPGATAVSRLGVFRGTTVEYVSRAIGVGRIADDKRDTLLGCRRAGQQQRKPKRNSRTPRVARLRWLRQTRRVKQAGCASKLEGVHTVPIELDSVARTLRRRGKALDDGERLGDVFLESEAVNLKVRLVGYGREQMDVQVVHAVRGDRQIVGLRQVGNLHPASDAAAIGYIRLGESDAASSDEVLAWSGGTFYARETQEGESYVQAGDHVEIGDTLGLLEVMKMFNPIRAKFAGTIRTLCVKGNAGVVVTRGQKLFEVTPDTPPSTESEEQRTQRQHEATLRLLEDNQKVCW